MEKLFHLKENGTNVKTEVMAGITTFLAMAYILAVNPSMLGDAGMNSQGVFMATALAAAVATIVMALLANYPIALASGMGLNAYFAYTICLGELADQANPWQIDLILVVHLSPPLCAVFLFCFLCESCDIPFRWFTPDVGISLSKKTRNAEFLPPSIFSPFPTTLAPDTDTLPTTVPYISALPEIRGDLRVLWSFLISASPRITACSTTRPDVTCAFSNTAAFPPHMGIA